MNLKAAIEIHLEETGLIKNGQSVLVAVSGGRDSMTLLHVLKSLAERWQLKLTVGHVNHGLRSESAEDEEFVRSISREWGIPCHFRRLTPNEDKVRINLEAWAREKRYQSLHELLEEIGCDCIVTAHHADDQAETVLYRLQQKSGLDGLRGIHPQIEKVVRPLLPFSRIQINDYIIEHDIPFIEDKTNEDLDYARNYIRHRILKPWKEKDPDLLNALNLVSSEAQKLVHTLDYMVERLAHELVRRVDHTTIRIPVHKTADLPEILVLRLFRHLSFETDPWRRNQWDELKSFLGTAVTGKMFTLSPKWRLLRDRDDWILSSRKPLIFDSVVQPEMEIPAGEHLFHWIWTDNSRVGSLEKSCERIDGNVLKESSVVLRNWKEGDVFQPLGMKGRRKVSDFLTDLKLNRFEKEQQLVLEAGSEIVWVCSRRISETVRISPKSRMIAEISLTPLAIS